MKPSLGFIAWLLSAQLASAATYNTLTETSTVLTHDSVIDAYWRDSTGDYLGSANALHTYNGGAQSASVALGTQRVVGFSYVAKQPGVNRIHYANGLSFSPPYPYQTGYASASGTISLAIINGAYDAAIHPTTGDLYISADPMGLGSNEILQYDWATGATQLVASVGGYSGGLSFDAAGDLFYGYVDPAFNAANNQLIRFSSEDVLGVDSNPLTLADAQTIASSINAGSIAITGAGSVFVRSLRSDFSGTDILMLPGGSDTFATVASIEGFDESFGKLFWDSGSLYTSLNKFSENSGAVVRVDGLSQVPEPAAAPFGAALLGLYVVMRRRHAG
jgi:hypothetical protein